MDQRRAGATIRMRYLGLVLALAVFSVAGCGAPKAVRTFECVADYARMTSDYDPRLSLVYLPDPASLEDATGLVIGDFVIGGDRVEDRPLAEDYAENFRHFIKYHLGKLGRFSTVSMDRGYRAPRRGEPPVYKLDGKITVFDSGNAWARYFSGLLFLGLGATDFQVEGRLTDLRTGRLIMEFVDRRRHLGGTPFGPSPKNLWDSQFAMRHAVYQTAGGLAYVICYGEAARVDDEGDDEDEDQPGTQIASDTSEEMP